MTKEDIKKLFSDLRLSVETNMVINVEVGTRFFGTNTQSASRVIYLDDSSWLEMCVIYFDSNNVVISYKHYLND